MTDDPTDRQEDDNPDGAPAEGYEDRLILCAACGWTATVNSVPLDPAYDGADWYCPHCGNSAEEYHPPDPESLLPPHLPRS